MNIQQPNIQRPDMRLPQVNTIFKTRLVMIFIFGFALGALTIIAWNNAPQPVKKTATPVSSGTSTITTTQNKTATTTGKIFASFSTGIGTGRVSVTNQLAGDSVLVESVTVPPPGVWVTVRETNGKELGNILGAAYIHGPRSNVTVTLLRNTQPNKLYVIELYRPGAEGSSFDVKTESVYVDFATGRSVIVPFRTEANTFTGIAQ